MRACTDVRALPYHPGRRHRGTYRAGQTEEHIGRGRQGMALSAPSGQTGQDYLQAGVHTVQGCRAACCHKNKVMSTAHLMTWWATELTQAAMGRSALGHGQPSLESARR